MITWNELVRLQPALNELLTETRSIERADGFCKHDCYALGAGRQPSLKRRLHDLVGWAARHVDPRITTSSAWDVATSVLLDALPSCQGCGCLDESAQFCT